MCSLNPDRYLCQQWNALISLATSLPQIKWNPNTSVSLPCGGMNANGVNVTSYAGVSCDSYGNVNTLSLNSLGLGVSLASFSQIESLTALQILDLSSNQMTGHLDSINWSVLMGNLTQLNLQSNSLAGTIPAIIFKSPLLNTVYFANNQLTGTLPDWTGLVSIQAFELLNNQLTGTIPPLEPLQQLVWFDIDTNLLSGSIPRMDRMPNLLGIWANNNLFTSNIPLFNPAIQYIWLNYNNLEGPLSPQMSNLVNANQIQLHGNQLSGDFIPDFSKSTYLSLLDVGSNLLRLKYNQISSLMPPTLQVLDLSDNLMVGNFDMKIFEQIPSLTWLNISKNAITGQVQDTGALSSSDARTGILLDARKIDFDCLYPEVPSSVLFLRDACSSVPQFKQVSSIIGGASAVAFFIMLIFFIISRQVFQSVTEKGADFWNGNRAFRIWFFSLIGIYDMVIDFNVYKNIIFSILFPLNFCPSVNSPSIFTSQMPWNWIADNGVNSFPFNYSNFADYYNQMMYGNQYSTGFNIPEYSNPGGVAQNILVFGSICTNIHSYESSHECQVVDNACTQTYVPNPFQSFTIFVYVSIGLVFLKESIKTVLILYYYTKGDDNNDGKRIINSRFVIFASQSVISPVLLFKKQLNDELLKHNNSYIDYANLLLVETLMENFPQIFITVYYSLVVAQNGLSLFVYFSLLANFCGIGFKVFSAYRKFVTRKDYNKSLRSLTSSPNSKSSKVEHFAEKSRVIKIKPQVEMVADQDANNSERAKQKLKRRSVSAAQ